MNDIKPKINLRDIKSYFILKRVFSFLYEKKELDIIKYNKALQKMFLVNIEFYKKISGKYKKGQRNGIGREYSIYTNELLFEGEYLNGKKNGKGKEYNKYGILEFEGEYRNGNRWNGKGKEYYYNGELKFKGEYLNGMEKDLI